MAVPCRIRACANADKALTQVIHFQLDLVLSDISMPRKDGFELLQEIRTLGRSSGGEVIDNVIRRAAKSNLRGRAAARSLSSRRGLEAGGCFALFSRTYSRIFGRWLRAERIHIG